MPGRGNYTVQDRKVLLFAKLAMLQDNTTVKRLVDGCSWTITRHKEEWEHFLAHLANEHNIPLFQ